MNFGKSPLRLSFPTEHGALIAIVHNYDESLSNYSFVQEYTKIYSLSTKENLETWKIEIYRKKNASNAIFVVSSASLWNRTILSPTSSRKINFVLNSQKWKCMKWKVTEILAVGGERSDYFWILESYTFSRQKIKLSPIQRILSFSWGLCRVLNDWLQNDLSIAASMGGNAGEWQSLHVFSKCLFYSNEK